AKLGALAASGLHPEAASVVVTAGVIVTMVGWSRLPMAGRLPGALVAIVVSTLAVSLLGWEVPTIGSVPRSLLLSERLHFGTIPWSDMDDLVVPALSVAALGAIESLLCGAVGGNMTGIRLHSSVELVAQGFGNMLIPFFGGVPATAAIARTSVNIKSGGVTRIAPIVHGLALLAVALLFAPILERIPLAALSGVLLVTAWRMNEWPAIRFFFAKRLRHAIAAFVVTLSATVLLDLTQAIVIGFGLSTLIFIAQISDLVVVRQSVDPARLEAAGHRLRDGEHAGAVYTVTGPLFFAAARKLLEEVEAHDGGDARLILSMRGVPLVDATGLEVLHELLARQRRGGGALLLAGLQVRVEALLRRAGFLDQLGEANVFWSADRAILALGGPLPDAPRIESPGESLADEVALAPVEGLNEGRRASD
ncbi:MAG: SulP family inorganic anion transporter, partial [Thermoanaerobaculia bacterium]|nr:SulP family inorganic anion transporter [Thermoanaerobaculia bacterium]